MNVTYDIVLVEGVQASYVYQYFKFKKLIVRASDDLGYLNLFSDEKERYEKMMSNSNQIWAVLFSMSEQYNNAVYLPNPSIYSKVESLKDKAPEAVYVGSNKCDNKLLIKVANSGIVVHVFTEGFTIKHKNIVSHGIIPKKDLVCQISKYKVGLIPFFQDSQNKHMEIPLKTYDYISAGLHVVMISSSVEIDTEIIQSARNHDEFISLVQENMLKDIDVDKYSKVLKSRGLDWFSNCIKEQLSLL